MINENVEETYTVLGRRTLTGGLEFWSDCEFDEDIELADIYDHHAPSAIVDEVIAIAQDMECKPEEISLMKVQRVLRLASEITFDETRLLEARRAKALAKLTQEEIEVLGLGNLATYSKLKFHNAPEEDL